VHGAGKEIADGIDDGLGEVLVEEEPRHLRGPLRR
jgi:hypothetical protein